MKGQKQLSMDSKQDGRTDFARFDALVRKVIAVPHAEIMRREAEYKWTV